MRKKEGKISLGIKIFAIAITMLTLLIAVAFFSYTHLSRVNDRVSDLAEYLIPITGIINIVDVHVLEQEIHFENIMKLYEIEPLDQEHITRELQQFEQRGVNVDQELFKAVQLSKHAIQYGKEAEDQDLFSRLEPIMQQVELEHQDFHDHALNVVNLLRTGKKEEAHRLEQKLETEEGHFDREVEQLRLELQQYTQRAAQITREEQQHVLYLNLIITLLGMVLGLLLATVLTLGLVRPVGKLMHAMREVGRGNLGVQVDVVSRDEIGFLADSFGSMVGELVLKEKVKEMFGKYVDPRVVESLIETPGGPETGGEKQRMTVLFSDIEGFDAIAEQLPPEDQVRFINQYLTLMSEPISTHSGVLDKFIGTMVMAFWGKPITSDVDHANMACEAALDQLAQLERIRRLASDSIDSTELIAALQLRIGIATGHLVVGNMGSEQSKSYTVLGDIVNTASRLKGACKQYGTEIMVTDSTQSMIRDVIETREIDLMKVIGKEEPVRVFELLGRKGKLEQNMKELRDTFEQGLQAYRSQKWAQAQRNFEDCLKLRPNDTPSVLYLERIKSLQENPPGDDWDGVRHLTKK